MTEPTKIEDTKCLQCGASPAPFVVRSIKRTGPIQRNGERRKEATIDGRKCGECMRGFRRPYTQADLDDPFLPSNWK